MIASRSRLSRGLCTIVIGVAGLALGGMIAASPAAAHFKPSLSHVWGHIKKQADLRYLQPAQGDARYLQPAQGDAAYVRKADATTVRGVYVLTTDDTGNGGFPAADTISFGLMAFPVAPTPHIIRLGQVPPAECPGNAGNPQAAPGHLCIYEARNFGTASLVVQDPAQGVGTVGTYGTMVVGSPANLAFTESSGTWAATLP